jgi:hypothetical protein
LTAVCALLLGVWCASGWWRGSLTWGRLIATVEAGRLTTYRAAASTPAYPLAARVTRRDPIHDWVKKEKLVSGACQWEASDHEARWKWAFAWEQGAKRNVFPHSMAVPLLPVFLGAAVVTGLRWRRDVLAVVRRRRGLCALCGYDLAGIGGAKCPECGAEEVAGGKG